MALNVDERLEELAVDVQQAYTVAEAELNKPKSADLVTTQNISSKTYLHRVEFENAAPKRLDLEGGERLMRDLTLKKIEGSVHAYGDQFAVPTEDILSADFAPAVNKAAQFGGAAARWQDDLVVEVLTKGTETTGPYARLNYDDKPLFASNRSVGDGTVQSNDLSGFAWTAAGWKSVVEHFAGIKDNMGRPMGLRPSKVIVPTADIGEATEFKNQRYFGSDGSTENVWAGTFDLVWLPNLPSGARYAVAEGVTPFTMYQLMAPTFSMFNDWNKHNVVAKLRAEMYWTEIFWDSQHYQF